MENEMIEGIVYDNLPDILKSVTSGFKGREKDIVLLSSLGVLSANLPNLYGIYDGKTVSPNLYTLFIAPPASGKGVMSYSRLLIERVHEKILKDSRAKIKDCHDKKDEKNKGSNNCPPLEVKIIPANISSSEMYAYLGSSKHGVVIIESEADTMSSMMKNDWSNYSDVLRKTFHHETVSISRKGDDNLYLEIKEPKLSIVMSGTPNQFKPLMQSKGNGLFSRFLMYTFNDVQSFKNVFAPEAIDFNEVFSKSGDVVFDLYSTLIEREKPLEFMFTENQQKRFLLELKMIHDIVRDNHSSSFISNVNRHGLMLFRLCMILSALRGVDEKSDKLVCCNRDFLISLKIIKTVLKHALIMHNSIDNGYLSETDEKFIFKLKKSFTTSEAVSVGEKLKIPKRTVHDKLYQWRKKKVIRKLSHGKYLRVLS